MSRMQGYEGVPPSQSCELQSYWGSPIHNSAMAVYMFTVQTILLKRKKRDLKVIGSTHVPRVHTSFTWITAFHAVLSNAKSLSKPRSVKSRIISSSHVSFGRPRRFILPSGRVMRPKRTGASAGLRWRCPNQRNRCCDSISFIGATPSLPRTHSFLIACSNQSPSHKKELNKGVLQA